MAECRGGREARLARVDLVAVFGGKAARIEHLALHSRLAGDDLPCAAMVQRFADVKQIRMQVPLLETADELCAVLRD